MVKINAVSFRIHKLVIRLHRLGDLLGCNSMLGAVIAWVDAGFIAGNIRNGRALAPFSPSALALAPGDGAAPKETLGEGRLEMMESDTGVHG